MIERQTIDEIERLREENESLREMISFLRGSLYDLADGNTKMRAKARECIKRINRLTQTADPD
jgi:uncharacterized coiled-coil DUF342 family protein